MPFYMSLYIHLTSKYITIPDSTEIYHKIQNFKYLKKKKEKMLLESQRYTERERNLAAIGSLSKCLQQ